MKVFVDSSVIVAALVAEHPHHAPAAALINRLVADGQRLYMSAHGVLEVYSVLTRAPFPLRIFPHEAWMMLNEGILRFTELVALTGAEYREVVEYAAEHSQAGGRVYDLIHIRAAQKANCDRLYTFNVKDFRDLADAAVRDRVCAP